MLYSDFVAVYDTWYKKQNDNVPPKIDGAAGNATKSLIGYFKSIVKAKAKDLNEVLTEDSQAAKVLESWSFILESWESLEPFYQDKTRLIDINSNIQNIIKQVKNGYRSKQTGRQGAKIGGNDIASQFSKVDSAFGQGANG